MKKQLGPKDILFPIPAALIVSGTLEKPNVMTVSWVGMMSISPPIVAIGIHESRYSFELIKQRREFTVNIPSANLYKEVDYIGMVSGKVRKKLKDVGFTVEESFKIDTPIISDCPFNIECTVLKSVKVSAHTVIFGEIVETHIDVDKINGETPKDIDLKKVNPLVYAATVGQYWSIGDKLGDSFAPGRKIASTLKN